MSDRQPTGYRNHNTRQLGENEGNLTCSALVTCRCILQDLDLADVDVYLKKIDNLVQETNRDW